MSKVVVITGSRKGIGRYLAEYYLGNEFIVVGCSRGESAIEDTHYYHYSLDISDEQMVTQMIKDTVRKLGKIDILINNAGIASMNHIVLTPLDTVKKIIDTNFIGTFNFCREISKVMIKQRWGRIVNISTVAVPLKLDGESIYVSSKAAIESFSKVIAKELAGFNITINVIGIAPLMTDLIKVVPKEKIEKILTMMAIPRLAEFKDVSNVIDFFIREESDYITGQIIYLGGVS